MAVVIRLRFNAVEFFSAEDQAPAQVGYPLRIRSWMVSLVLHGLLVGVAWTGSEGATKTRRPILDDYIRPNRHRIVYFPPLPPKQVAVRPDREFGNSETPRAPVVSADAVVSKPPVAQSPKALVYQPPKPRLVIEPEASAAVAAAAAAPPVTPPAPMPDLAAAPPPPRARKAFVPPPPVRTSIDRPKLMLEPAPVAEVKPAPTTLGVTTGADALARLAPPPRPKAFVPPATVGRAPAPAKMVMDSDGLAVAPGGASRSAAGAAGGAAWNALGNLPGAPAPAVPASRAPTAGEPSSGRIDQARGVVVPNLLIQPASVPAPAAPPATPPATLKPEVARTRVVLYSDRLRTATVSTLSVPLRPANRMIPRALESRFQGRNVYTVVIPIENFTDYAGDWICWFAEAGSRAEVGGAIRPPVPLRKRELVDRPAIGEATVHRVQVSGLLKLDGRLHQIAVASPRGGEAVEQLARADIQTWEFVPATRNGQGVEIDLVFEYSIQVPGRALLSAKP